MHCVRLVPGLIWWNNLSKQLLSVHVHRHTDARKSRPKDRVNLLKQ